MSAIAAALPTEPQESLLSLDDLTVRFGGLTALGGVSLTVSAGEVLGIIGPNGAGKTTLLNAVGCLVPSTGTISFAGDDLRRTPVHRLRSLGVARSFQHPQLDPHMTVREVLGLGTVHRQPYGWPSAALGRFAPKLRHSERDIASELEPIIATLRLEPWCDTLIADTPHGVQKLTDIARAMIGDPRMLLLDEPFAGLSEDESKQVIDVIRQRRSSRSSATLLIDHHVEHVVSAATVLCAMVDGRMAAYGSAEEVLADETVKAAYLG